MLSHLAHAAEQEGVVIAMEALRPEESQIVTTLADAKRMLDEIRLGLHRSTLCLFFLKG
ncbi:hypothetical protein D3C74_427450 [compost metagenome]